MLADPTKNQTKELIKSGDIFEKTGCYSYLSHVDKSEECLIPAQTGRMLFKRGEVAPNLISCRHDIYWKLVFTC